MNRATQSRQASPLVVPRVTQEFFPVVSGPANQALAIARGMEACGFHAPILTTTPLGAASDPSGVTVRRFRPLVSGPNFHLAPGLIQAALQAPMQALHIHGWRNPASDGALLAALRRGVPVVLQAHGIANGHRYTIEPGHVRAVRTTYEALIRPLVTRAAAAVVASTRAEAAELQAYGFSAKQIVVIPIGVAAPFFAARAVGARPGEPLQLLTVGRLGPLRNLEQIFEALALLRLWEINVRLRVVGPEVSLAAGEPTGYRRRLEELAYGLGLSDVVTFCGALHGEALVAAYAAADMFICTTRYENFGQPIAEAAAVGLPVVATPTGVAPDLIGDGGAGRLVAFGDAAATAAALRDLCVHERMRRAMGAAARRYATQHCDWQRIIPRYVELYETLASPDAGPARARPAPKERR